MARGDLVTKCRVAMDGGSGYTQGTAQFSRQTYTWTSELLTIVQLQGRLELTDFHHLLLIMMFWKPLSKTILKIV